MITSNCFDDVYAAVSSAYNASSIDLNFGMSAMNNEYRIGEMHVPCAKPAGMVISVDLSLLTYTANFRFLINALIILVRNIGSFNLMSLQINPSCQIESKAFSMSSKIMPVDHFRRLLLSMDFLMRMA